MFVVIIFFSDLINFIVKMISYYVIINDKMKIFNNKLLFLIAFFALSF